MKKILGLLLVSSSVFSMELAYKVQTPYSRANAAKLSVMSNACKPYAASNPIDVPIVRINPSSVRAPRKLQDAELYHDKDGFAVKHYDEKHIIEQRFMDAAARKIITKEQLNSFLKSGFFVLSETNDGSFTLKANPRLIGGGPLLGSAMYILTKGLCYVVGLTAVGTAATITGAAALPTGILAAGGTAAAGAVTTAAVAAGTGTVIGTTAGVLTVTAGTSAAVMSGATIIAAGTTAAAATTGGAVLGTAALTTTGAVLSTGVSAAGIFVSIEAVSSAVGTFFGMLPTP